MKHINRNMSLTHNVMDARHGNIVLFWGVKGEGRVEAYNDNASKL